MKLGHKIWNALRPDAQAFDEVRIRTIPRYKQSGLSGDEWRIHAEIEFYRKGALVHSAGARDIETACGRLYAEHGNAIDNGKAYFAGDGIVCDQEGCAEPATIRYWMKKSYNNDGTARELNNPTLRCFCERHKTRGDCGLDDADDNYELATQESIDALAPDPAPDKPAPAPRASGVHTKDVLAKALHDAGLPAMAARAATGYYHDFLSPLADPTTTLVTELALAGTDAALALQGRVINGEFDATTEESDAWAKGAEGQAALSHFVAGRTH